jgi:hypothetical protein
MGITVEGSVAIVRGTRNSFHGSWNKTHSLLPWFVAHETFLPRALVLDTRNTLLPCFVATKHSVVLYKMVEK